MPDWNDPQTWQDAYALKGSRPGKPGYGQWLTYLDGRDYAGQLARDESPGLSHHRHTLQKLGATGISPAAQTLVVGCGLGWMVETLDDIGSNAVWGADTSTLIQTEWDNPAMGILPNIRLLLHGIDIQDPDAAAQFKAVGAGNNKGEFRNIITEHVLEGMELVDIPLFLDDCESVMAAGQSNILHLVAASDTIPPGASDPSIILTELSLAEWAALRPAHFWIDVGTGLFLGGA